MKPMTKRRTNRPPVEEDLPAAQGGLFASETRGAVRGTLALLRWLRAFLASDKERAPDPHGWRGDTITKDEAARKLERMVDVAVNRRGLASGQAITHGLGEGWTQGAEGRQYVDFVRDQNALRDIARRVRVYRFDSKACQARFAHLLASRED